ncbi:hypothetical protein BPOR_0396g00060 [Botrytis porri]|uniref:Uncharacterized protein n=1 Tax=Botrytis porri TaxID=87229 RepID=A0A4Z1KP37_9HELO|nr:hypothetical protein BPOR_0396g00060 [Botrytis porri]
MDRNQADGDLNEQGENEGEYEQRGRSQTPRARTLSPVSVATDIPSNGTFTPDSTSVPTPPLEALNLNPNLEPNLTLAHITSLPQTTILDYISAYRLARQRSLEKYVHPLLDPSQTVAPEFPNHILNDADDNSDLNSSSTSTPWSMPALVTGPEQSRLQRSHSQNFPGQSISPHWRHHPAALSPSPTTWRPGSGLPFPPPYETRVNGDDRPITLTEGQDNVARNRRDREISPRAHRIDPSSIVELENEEPIDVDSESVLQVRIQVQSQRLRQASPVSRDRIRGVLTRLVIRRLEDQAREEGRNFNTENHIEAGNVWTSQTADSRPRDLSSANTVSRPPVLTFNQDGTISLPQDRVLLNPLNNTDSSVHERIDADTGARRERRELASASPEVTSVVEAQDIYPSVEGLLIDLESQVRGMRNQILGTDLTRPEILSGGGVNFGMEQSGVEIDLDTILTRPPSQPSYVEDVEDAEPSMAEQLAAYQISRNHPNPESSNTNRNTPRAISPHDNSELPDLSQILTGYQDDLSRITTRIQLARRRAELQLAERRIRAALPIESRDISPYNLENPHTLTRAPRLRPSTSFEDLRLERQLAALSPASARNTIPAHRRTLFSRAQRESNTATVRRAEMLQRPAITAFDHLGKWQLYLENAATRIDSHVPEEWCSRIGKYTLIPSSSSTNSIEDVSGMSRSDEEILAAYSANTSYGFREIMRMVKEDGLGAREAWHYVLLWRDYLSESPIDEYHEMLGCCPMDVFMHVVIQGLNRGFGDWKMSEKCKRECNRYLLTRTSYYPFPSAETIDVARTFGDVTPESLREYFDSDISFLDEEWDMLATLKNEGYATARILHLAKNIARGIAKLETIDLKPPYDESNNAQRKDMFHRLKLEEIALAGQCGMLSAREHQALSADESSAEHVLVEYMLKWELVPDERDRMFQAFDGGAPLESLMSSRRR